MTQPLQVLLHKNYTWFWDKHQENSFSQLKLELTRPVILTHYDQLAEAKVSADASSIGLDAVLRCWHVETCCFCLNKPVRYKTSVRTN